MMLLAWITLLLPLAIVAALFVSSRDLALERRYGKRALDLFLIGLGLATCCASYYLSTHR